MIGFRFKTRNLIGLVTAALGALSFCAAAADAASVTYDQNWLSETTSTSATEQRYSNFARKTAEVGLADDALMVDGPKKHLQVKMTGVSGLGFVFGVDKLGIASGQIGHLRIDALLGSIADVTNYDVGLWLGNNKVSFRPGVVNGYFKCTGDCEAEFSALNPVNMGWTPSANQYHTWGIDIWPDTSTIAVTITDATTATNVFRVNITDTTISSGLGTFAAGPMVDVLGASTTGVTICSQIKFTATERAAVTTALANPLTTAVPVTTARPTTTGIAVTTAVTTTGIVGSTTNQALATTGARSSATTGPIAATSAAVTTGTAPTTTGSAPSTTGINTPPNKAKSSPAGANDGSGVVLVIIIVAVIVLLVLCAAVGVVLARRRRGALRQSVSDGSSDSASTEQHYAKTPESVKGASPYAKTPDLGTPESDYARTPDLAAMQRESDYARTPDLEELSKKKRKAYAKTPA
jgi:hypothetical protein